MRNSLLAVLLTVPALFGQSQESNVIYGMYSGLALLMDVHKPAQPNGYGVVFISGSGWHAPVEWGSEPLAKGGQTKIYAPVLTKAGYTVFSLTHRAAPRFRYPAAVEDVQRAVRFVRHNAQRFGIRADRIGAVGGSSGGHLVLMLGTLDGAGDSNDKDPVARTSAKVQCVVARAAPADLAAMAGAAPAVVSFMGAPPPGKAYQQASPVTHVSGDDPPTLLIHGDADASVPFNQSERILELFAKAGVASKLLRIPGGAHGPTFGNVKNAPDYMVEMIAWLDKYLPR